MELPKLFIYGSGGAGCELSDSVSRIQSLSPRWKEIAFVDDIRQSKIHYGLSVVKFEEMISSQKPYQCVISLGEPEYRRRLYDRLLAHAVPLAQVIDPTAIISGSAQIEEGCVIGANAFVSSNSRIGSNAMLQIKTIVGHDISIGDHSVISSCVVVGGNSSIGEMTFVGMNSTIKEKIRIGKQAIIGMGSAVFHSVDDNLIALGNPARVIRKNQDGLVFGKVEST